MFTRPDYQNIIEFNWRLIRSLEEQPERIRKLNELITEINLGLLASNHFISKPLYEFLSALNLLSLNPNEVPVSIFLWVYCHLHFRTLQSEMTYKEIINVLNNSAPSQHEQLQDSFKETAFRYLVLNKKLSWSSLIESFDYSNWKDIDTSADLLPLADAHLPEIINWGSSIIKIHANDGALGALHYDIENWVLLVPHGAQETRENICNIAIHPEVSYFLRSFLKGLQSTQPEDFDFYRKKFENLIVPGNARAVSMGLQIGVSTKKERTDYFELLLNKLNIKQIEPSDFFTICGLYGFYEESIFEKVEKELVETENSNTIASISRYLERLPSEIDRKWYFGSLQLIFSKMRSELKHAQNQLLGALAETDLDLAYNLFEFRMKIMGGNEFLEEGLLEVVRRDIPQFQKRFVQWLATDNDYIHTGLRYVTFTQKLDSSLFNIPKGIFQDLSTDQKIFAAYKIVGYVYSTEELQSLLISLVESTDEDNEALERSLYFIFSKYLVYNYRGTLDLLKKELQTDRLSSFARGLFTKIIEEYKIYFEALKRIAVNKELEPYPKQVQLRNFYFKQLFSDIPRQARNNSILGLFKSVSINSHNWVIRRKREEGHNHNPIHNPQPLGNISVTKEFPSGETLDPVFQEEIRRTYQNIRIDEIRSN
jgi:hypothetical protein